MQNKFELLIEISYVYYISLIIFGINNMLLIRMIIVSNLFVYNNINLQHDIYYHIKDLVINFSFKHIGKHIHSSYAFDFAISVMK